MHLVRTVGLKFLIYSTFALAYFAELLVAHIDFLGKELRGLLIGELGTVLAVVGECLGGVVEGCATRNYRFALLLERVVVGIYGFGS